MAEDTKLRVLAESEELVLEVGPIDIEAAHYLPDYVGACSRLHGHRWELTVVFGPFILLDHIGMAADFKKLKAAVREVVEMLDHEVVNDFIDQPTAERMTMWFKDEISQAAFPYPVESITLAETRGNKARLRRRSSASPS